MIRKSFNIIAAILIVSFGVLITLLHYLTPPQWPTIITSLMFPVLLFVYYRLSKREENEMSNLFGDDYRKYMGKTPMFIPKLGSINKNVL